MLNDVERVKRRLLVLCGVAAFVFAFASAYLRAEGVGPEIFNDFMAAAQGNDEALSRTLAALEKRLAANSKDADALVLHGAATYVHAGRAFQSGDMDTGISRMNKGGAEMQKAVELAPDNSFVRTVRGGTLLETTKYMDGSPDQGTLLDTGIADIEHLLTLKPAPGSTPRPEERARLLSQLADGYERAGKMDKARSYYQKLSTEFPETADGRKAVDWLKSHPAK